MKRPSFTKHGILWVAAPLLHLLLWLLCLWLASVLEVPFNNSGPYTIIAAIDIFLLYMYPIVAVIGNIAAICNAVRAVRNGESKWINAVLIAIAVTALVISMILSYRFWIRTMGV